MLLQRESTPQYADSEDELIVEEKLRVMQEEKQMVLESTNPMNEN